MLGKLLKYEWKTSGKIFLGLNLYMIIITIMGIIMLSIGITDTGSNVFSAITSLLSAFYILSIFAISIAVFILLFYRFFKSLYTDEGYLTHTLPIQPSIIFLSKFIYGFLCTSVTSIIIMFSILFILIGASPEKDIINSMQKGLAYISSEIGISVGGFIMLMILYTIISFATGLLCFYASISLGQLFKKHKVIGSFVWYGVFYIIGQIFSTIYLIVMGFPSFDLSNKISANAFVNRILSTSLVFAIISCIIYWLICNYVISKKLNLE
jgi:hypothetical protein